MKNEKLNIACTGCANCTDCVRLPENGQLRSWVDCSDCVYGDYTPGQGYWCRRFGGYDTRGGCMKGVER